MTNPICRWGILSTANIARKNWLAIRNTGNAVVTVVASRTKEKSQQFINECQASAPFAVAPQACGTYDELLTRDDVDAIYIPLPTGIRKEWVIRAADAGKHVLCEKPVGISPADVVEMLAACKKNNVQFMDGVMFMHSRRLSKLREVLDDGESVGTLRRICSQFSFAASDEFVSSNIRASGDLEPLGCLGDLGWYNIRFTLWAMKYQTPHTVSGRLLTQDGRAGGGSDVPMEFSGELFFADGVSASFYCSFLNENQQWANLSGSKGFVHVPGFVCPFYGSEVSFDVNNTKLVTDGCLFNMEEHVRRVAVHEYGNGAPSAQETNLFRNFSELALSGKPDESWGQIALQTQQVMQATLESARQDGKLVKVS
jgi:predicted dehydrogenase